MKMKEWNKNRPQAHKNQYSINENEIELGPKED